MNKMIMKSHYTQKYESKLHVEYKYILKNENRPTVLSKGGIL